MAEKPGSPSEPGAAIGKEAARHARPRACPSTYLQHASGHRQADSTLQDIAKQKKVSVAWVIRDAAEKYIIIKLVGARRLCMGADDRQWPENWPRRAARADKEQVERAFREPTLF
jgi:hypothetical protein